MELSTIAKLAIAPISLLSGIGILGASFATTPVKTTVSPYSTEEVIVNEPVQEPAKSLLMFGGSAIAVIGSVGGIFAGIEDHKRRSGLQQPNFTQTNEYPQLPYSVAPTRALPPNQQQRQNLRQKQTQQQVPSGQGFARPPAQIPQRNPANNQQRPPAQVQPNQQGKRQAPPNQQQQQRQVQPDTQSPTERLPLQYAKLPNAGSASNNPGNVRHPGNPGNAPALQPAQNVDRFEEIRSLLLSIPTLLIYGSQGSGKTSKGGWLAAEHMKLGHLVLLVNPLAKWKFFEGIKTYGKGINFKDAADGIMRFVDEANRRLRLSGTSDYNPFSEQHWVLLCDEMTNWEAKMPLDVMTALIEVCTQLLRQANMSVIFTSHGKTLTCFGGRSAGNGKFDVLKRQFTMLRCVSKSDPNIEGGKTCAGYAKLEWLDDEDQERSTKVTIPSGMVPPNPEKTANGVTWYDFRPLLPAQPENIETDDDIINRELAEDDDLAEGEEKFSTFDDFVQEHKILLENFQPPDEWGDI
ncbi:MAG: ATP-binding protein [Crinalium sp.]